MKQGIAAVLLIWLIPSLAAAAPSARLTLPDFAALSKKASESVSITLDPNLLSMAARFLDSNDPEEAQTIQVIKGLQGIYIRSFTFDADDAYRASDIDAIRSQLSAPGWNRLVETRSRKTHANVDIYVMMDKNQAIGLAVIASEPRQFTIVNIVGAIDLDKLHKLEGQLGVPKLDIEDSKPDTPKASPPAKKP
jgi:Domain of unknown function (DUF4252)